MRKGTLFRRRGAAFSCQRHGAAALVFTRGRSRRSSYALRATFIYRSGTSWLAEVQKPDGSNERPYFEVQQSRDLRYWQPIGQRMRAASAAAREPLHVTLLPDERPPSIAC